MPCIGNTESSPLDHGVAGGGGRGGAVPVLQLLEVWASQRIKWSHLYIMPTCAFVEVLWEHFHLLLVSKFHNIHDKIICFGLPTFFPHLFLWSKTHLLSKEMPSFGHRYGHVTQSWLMTVLYSVHHTDYSGDGTHLYLSQIESFSDIFIFESGR